MTISGNLAPAPSRGNELESPYPVFFGITFTPVVSGILLASLGVLGALYLLINFVQPLWQQKQELEQSVATKESQISNQKNTLKEITKVENDLKTAQQRQAEVLSLYADPDQLKTLLLDINQIARERNSKLTKFEPSTPEPEPIADGSVGAVINGKLERQAYKVEMEGTFESTRSTILTLERLQPLLLVKNLKSQIGSQKAILRKMASQAPVLEFDPEADELKTSFDLIAIMPVNPPSPLASPESVPLDGQVKPGASSKTGVVTQPNASSKAGAAGKPSAPAKPSASATPQKTAQPASQ